jgi:hypothetical protein
MTRYLTLKGQGYKNTAGVRGLSLPSGAPLESWPSVFGGTPRARNAGPYEDRRQDARRAWPAVGALRFGRFGWVVGVAIQTFRWRQQC